MTQDVGAVCRAEVHRLHRVIADWTTGAVPDTGREFAAFAESFAPTFVIINPGGQAETADTVIARFRTRHGDRKSLGFTIEISDEVVRMIQDDHALIMYREHWLHRGEERSVILATALLQVDAAGPAGVVWHHLHETWLRPPV